MEFGFGMEHLRSPKGNTITSADVSSCPVQERDLAAAVRVGVNALRIHVHVENNEFYDLCDQMGIVVIQDSDLNWTFPTDEQFTQRALAVVGGMIKRLRNHPSIIAWICINEAQEEFEAMARPGPQLVAEVKRPDPIRPTIRNSDYKNDLESGDAHDYRGSLGRGHYADIFGSTEKLATEFGVDAPPGPLPFRWCLSLNFRIIALESKLPFPLVFRLFVLYLPASKSSRFNSTIIIYYFFVCLSFWKPPCLHRLPKKARIDLQEKIFENSQREISLDDLHSCLIPIYQGTSRKFCVRLCSG